MNNVIDMQAVKQQRLESSMKDLTNSMKNLVEAICSMDCMGQSVVVNPYDLNEIESKWYRDHARLLGVRCVADVSLI